VKQRVRHPIIQQDIEQVAKTVGTSLDRLRGKRLLITGGTGFIGTWLLETISWLNDRWDHPCRVYVPTRSPETFIRKVPHLVRADIVLLPGNVRAFEYPDDRCDMIIHAAAPADPYTLDRDPLGVATTIVDGMRRVLELAAHKQVESFLFVSSGAVYGLQPPELECQKIMWGRQTLPTLARRTARRNGMPKCCAHYTVRNLVFPSGSLGLLRLWDLIRTSKQDLR